MNEVTTALAAGTLCGLVAGLGFRQPQPWRYLLSVVGFLLLLTIVWPFRGTGATGAALGAAAVCYPVGIWIADQGIVHRSPSADETVDETADDDVPDPTRR